jgi:hypothetical protein
MENLIPIFKDINPYYVLIWLFFLHWFGDFRCQTRWMADNKSKNVFALMFHILVYGSVLAVGTVLLFPKSNMVHKDPWMAWLVVNMVLHMVTDAITSRITSRLWEEKNVKGFFDTIGFDQFIHAACLIGTTQVFLT